MVATYGDQVTENYISTPRCIIYITQIYKKHYHYKMPMLYKSAAEGKDIKPPPIPSPGNNSFLGDTFTSDAPKEEQISCGFYKQEKGEPLVYHYDYDEMKVILEVVGEYFISDEEGLKVSAKAGDVFYFKKGTTITFEATTGYGYAFFTGLRPNGTA